MSCFGEMNTGLAAKRQATAIWPLVQSRPSPPRTQNWPSFAQSVAASPKIKGDDPR